MGGRTRIREWALVAAGLAAFGPACAFAADPRPPSPPPDGRPAVSPEAWSFSLSLYGWAAGIDGRVRTLPPLPAVDVSLGFGDVLRNLDGAVMGLVEARRGRWMALADLVYSSISPDRAFNVAGVAGTVSVDSRAFIGLGALGYRVLETGSASLDAFAGVRVWALDNTLTVTVPAVGSVSYGKSKAWADGVIGGRVLLPLGDRLTASVIASLGGLAAKVEWDVYAGLSYAVTPTWSGFAGYRALHVDYRSGDFLYKATQHGPVLGISVNF